jgi:uncharacterized protein
MDAQIRAVCARGKSAVAAPRGRCQASFEETSNASGGRQAIGPVRDRIELLDALRGFALLGIILVNIRAWSGWFTLSPAQKDVLAGGAESEW